MPEIFARKALAVEVPAIVIVQIQCGHIVAVGRGDRHEFVVIEGAVLAEVGQIEQALDEALRQVS